MTEAVTAIVLAGGRGARLGGRPKTALKIAGRTLLDIKIRALGDLCTQIVLVVNRADFRPPPGVRTAADIRPGEGPLMGLYTGLLASRTRLNFVTGVDMPFFRVELFRHLESLAAGAPYDVTVPYVRRLYEPLFAFYGRDCLPAVEAALERRLKKVTAFFPHVRVRRVEAEEIITYDAGMRSFFNINTQEDLNVARKLSRRGGEG